MDTWFGNACGNTFLVLFPNSNEHQLVTRHLNNLRHKQQWTFDSALVLWPTKGANVAMQVIERDGTTSNMCGNGARVVGKILTLQGKASTIKTGQGVLRVSTTRQRLLSVCLGKIAQFGTRNNPGNRIFTTYEVCGEPHAVGIVKNVHQFPLSTWGRSIVPAANCTIVSPVAKGIIEARTYERGVNKITESCGTGACAAAFAMRENADSFGKMEVRMHNHVLKVHQTTFGKLTLEGPALVRQITKGDKRV